MSDDNEDTTNISNNIEDGQEIMTNAEQPEVSPEPSADSKPITFTINRAWAKVAAFMLAGFLGFIAGAFVTHHGLDDGPRGGKYRDGHSRMHQFDDRDGRYGPGHMMPGNGMGMPECDDDMPAGPNCYDQNDTPVNPEESRQSPAPTN